MPSLELWLEDGNLVCDLGIIDNPDPVNGKCGHLMLITRDLAEEIAVNGCVSLNRGGKRFVWKLHDAHWWDGLEPAPYVGAWPD